MTLELNDNVKPFKEFEGSNYKQMPKLIAEGRMPLSFAGLMKRKLQVLSGSPEVRDAWYDNYVDTGDGIAYDRSGNVKIELDSPIMRGLNPKSEIKSGALVISDNAFENIRGEEFTSKDIAKYKFGTSLSESEVVEHPFWNALARGDKALLKEYAHAVFKLAKEKYGYDKNMGVYLSSFREVPNMRLWLSNRLGGSSDAGGYDNLDANDGRLVRVAPEAQNAHERTSIIVPSLDDIMKISTPYVAEINKDALKRDLKESLYK
jgi:hypothetical protein